MAKVVTEGHRRSLWPWKPMSSNATDEKDGAVGDEQQGERYAELNIGDEEFVIYDRENHQAWIQSSVAVTVRDSNE